MNIEAVNATLTKAIVLFHERELEEAIAVGLSSYKVPSPKAFGKKKLSAPQRKKLIAKIYKLLPPNNRDILKDEGGYYPKRTPLKGGGRRVVYWGWNIETMMGQPIPKTKSGKGQSFVYLDELSDELLNKLHSVLDKRASRGPAGLKWKDTAKGPKLVTKVSGEKLIEVLRYMCAEKMAAQVNGILIDMSSACLVVQIADKLKPENRKKYLSLPIGRMASMAWELASKSGGVTFGS